VVDEVFPVQREDAERARDVLLARWELPARDALHVAVMQRHRVDRIVSFDRAFDAVAGLSRLA
jgi:predicted nucleic acid-binding protein